MFNIDSDAAGTKQVNGYDTIRVSGATAETYPRRNAGDIYVWDAQPRGTVTNIRFRSHRHHITKTFGNCTIL